MKQERDIVDELREIQRMNTTLHGAQMAARAADEIERLRAERDSARMWICRFDAESRSKYARRCGMSDYDYTPLQMAQERGWDCFKENTND